MVKEEEIAGLLSQGIAPAELVRKGYARGIVYKVRGRLEQPGTAQEKGDTTVVTDSGLDPALEADPEIMELKKALRKVELERQIEEIRDLPPLRVGCLHWRRTLRPWKRP